MRTLGEIWAKRSTRLGVPKSGEQLAQIDPRLAPAGEATAARGKFGRAGTTQPRPGLAVPRRAKGDPLVVHDRGPERLGVVDRPAPERRVVRERQVALMLEPAEGVRQGGRGAGGGPGA